MLNVSIVLYNHTVAEIEPLIQSLAAAKVVKEIFLVDNSPAETPEFGKMEVTYLFNGKNLGYGAAHNRSITGTLQNSTSYHLVLNPDIQVQPAAIEQMVNFMDEHPDVGQLMPKILYPNGNVQYLCKLLPKPTDLLARRFLPYGWFYKSNQRFELRQSSYNKLMEVPYLSGCFMLLRTSVLKQVGMFDEQFFMYPEDIDLTRRIHKHFKTVFYPYATAVHIHQKASYKNYKMLFIHLINLVKYFNKWGWFFDKERKKVNRNTLEKLNLL